MLHALSSLSRFDWLTSLHLKAELYSTTSAPCPPECWSFSPSPCVNGFPHRKEACLGWKNHLSQALLFNVWNVLNALACRSLQLLWLEPLEPGWDTTLTNFTVAMLNASLVQTLSCTPQRGLQASTTHQLSEKQKTCCFRKLFPATHTALFLDLHHFSTYRINYLGSQANTIRALARCSADSGVDGMVYQKADNTRPQPDIS